MNDKQDWARVPVLVQDLYIKYAAAARELVEGAQNHPGGWVLETPEIGPVLVKRADTAEAAKSGLFPTLGRASTSIQSVLGGPNPLTSMLLGGALGGGLGYGGGWLLHKLFPKAFNRRTSRAFGLLGGLGGAALPFMLHGVPALKHQGIKGLFTQQPLQGGEPYEDIGDQPLADVDPGADLARIAAGGTWDSGANQWAYPNGQRTEKLGPVPDPEYYENWNKGASSRFSDVVDKLTQQLGMKCASDDLEKHALAGAEFLPSIPTDEWGQVVMRDPFLDNPEKALAIGLPAAAGAMRGSRWVSPRDVAHVAANAGLGFGYGYLGSLAAKFLGLTEPVQKGIQRAGLLAGAIRGITGMGL